VSVRLLYLLTSSPGRRCGACDRWVPLLSLGMFVLAGGQVPVRSCDDLNELIRTSLPFLMGRESDTPGERIAVTGVSPRLPPDTALLFLG
jgi:hypothetical protein